MCVFVLTGLFVDAFCGDTHGQFPQGHEVALSEKLVRRKRRLFGDVYLAFLEAF